MNDSITNEGIQLVCITIAKQQARPPDPRLVGYQAVPPYYPTCFMASSKKFNNQQASQQASKPTMGGSMAGLWLVDEMMLVRRADDTPFKQESHGIGLRVATLCHRVDIIEHHPL